MARTNTYAKTQTYPRLFLLKLQVMTTLGQLVALNEKTKEVISDALSKQWISVVKVFGYKLHNDQMQKVCQITLSIDWDKHCFYLESSDVVSVDKTWKDGIMVEISESINVFKDVVREENLDVDYVVCFNPKFDTDMIRKAMGFMQVAETPWRGAVQEVKQSNKHLAELGISFKVSD